MPIVGREREAFGVRGGDEREQVVEILRRRALADPDVHAAAHLLVRLGAGEALVIRAHARADVRVQVEARKQRRMAVDENAARARVFDLRAHGRVAHEKAGHVHHLREAEDARQPV